MADQEAWVWLAEIRRPQGRKGEVLASILTDFPEKFAERRHVWLLAPQGPAQPRGSDSNGQAPGKIAPRAVELVHHWMHKGSVVLHFAGVDSISDAEALRGQVVAIPRAERAALDPDTYYIGDLMGCAVVDVHGGGARPAGVIVDVDRSAGPVALLVLEHAQLGELLIPFAKSYLRRVDLEARRLEMDLPAGLLELNAAGTGPEGATCAADAAGEVATEGKDG